MRVRTLQDHNDHDGAPRKAGAVYCTPPERAQEMATAGLVAPLEALTDVRWDQAEGRILTGFESTQYDAAPIDPAAPRVAQLTVYDPGSAGYRYHSAANSVVGGTSAFVRYGNQNPFTDLRQYDGDRSREGVARLVEQADAVLVHMDYGVLDDHLRAWPDAKRQLLIRHYHGSNAIDKGVPEFMQLDLDEQVGATLVGARLYHNRYSDRMRWLPIPMPVRDYERLPAATWKPIEERHNRCFRLAHSPTHPRIKGTVALEYTVDALRRKGLLIELVMIKDLKHPAALAMKASCDATFDSFWLGIQGSGLEAACMNQPVIAGDPDVVEDYRKAGIPCPYTFAPGPEELADVLERMVLDAAWRQAEADRVGQYVREHHDYPAVGRKFWEIVRADLALRGLRAAA